LGFAGWHLVDMKTWVVDTERHYPNFWDALDDARVRFVNKKYTTVKGSTIKTNPDLWKMEGEE